eukprot:4833880-Pleurochrysis_carterae.AAC.7
MGGSGAFPTVLRANRITQRNPNMRVKVANGVTLFVERIGSIVLRIPAGNVCTPQTVLRFKSDGEVSTTPNGNHSDVETTLEPRDLQFTCSTTALLYSQRKRCSRYNTSAPTSTTNYALYI